MVLKKPTIKDVALKAGVSIAIVSYVLNDTAGQSIPQRTRDRILEAVKEINYVPNAIARGMRTKKTQILGLVSFWDITESVFIEILDGVYKAADRNDYIITICNLNSLKREFSYIDLYKKGQIDGIIFISPYEWKGKYNEDVHLEKIKENGIPTVIIHGITQDDEFSYIYVDHYGTAFMATEYLIKLGHREIGFLLPDEAETASIGEMRLKGFLAAHQKYGILCDNKFNFRLKEGEKIAKLIKEGHGPTGIVANKSFYAAEFYKICSCHQIKIPDDVSVIAANKVPYASLLNPPLTSVGIPFQQMGERGVEILIDNLNKKIHSIKLKIPNILFEMNSCRDIEI